MQENILIRTQAQIKKHYYSYERYNVESTFALLYHEKPLPLIELSQFVRTSDHLISIDENHYFIIFAFTSEADAYKAAQNLLMKLDNHFNATRSAIALDGFDTSNSAQIVVSRLKDILKKARQDPFVRIETENALDDLI